MNLTLICMDKLAGGDPKLTFSSLMLNTKYAVVVCDVSGIMTRQDRVWKVVSAFNSTEGDVVLVGYSAEDSAVRLAAQHIEDDRLKGVVLLSAAPPRWVPYLTLTLLSCMIKYFFHILFGRSINLTKKEYCMLVGPVSKDFDLDTCAVNRCAISGVEARELAFHPPKLPDLKIPILTIGGYNDRWVWRGAQYVVAYRMETDFYVFNSGHMVHTHSKVIDCINHWLDNL